MYIEAFILKQHKQYLSSFMDTVIHPLFIVGLFMCIKYSITVKKYTHIYVKIKGNRRGLSGNDTDSLSVTLDLSVFHIHI